MLIGFTTSGIPFDGNSIKTGSLGGSETALISVSRELAKRGHTVRVFCRCPNPGVYDGVEYYNLDIANHQVAITPFDVLVASRWSDFVAIPSNIGLRVLWNHDVLVSEKDLMPRLWQTDLLMCLSDYHIDDYCGPEGEEVKGKIPCLRPFIWKTSNGVDLDVIEANKRPKVPGKLIYTSRPERGLYYLLHDIMPRLLERRPRLRLHYCTYELKGMEVHDSLKTLYAEIDRLAKGLGNSVVNMGSLGKAGLYSQMSSSQLMVYSTHFCEISCLGAMETQAAGTPIISTDDFALKETIGPKSGIKIPGRPANQDYVEKFVAAVDSLLDENNELNERGKQMSEEGPKFIREQGYTWDKVAEKWERKFTEMLETRYKENKPAIIKELLRSNDVQTATLLAKKEGMQEWQREIDTHERVVKTLDISEVSEKVKEYAPFYNKIINLIADVVQPNYTFLDYNCDDVAFGITFKKAASGIPVTLLAASPEIAERLGVYNQQLNIGVKITADHTELKEKFDVVFIGDQLDQQIDPQGFLERVSEKYLKEGGLLVVTCNYGTEKLKWNLPSTRLWNLSREDINDLLSDKEGEYRLLFHDTRPHQDIAPIGKWAFLARGFKKFGKFNILQKAKRTRPYQDLDVAMIVRNEEDWISGALKSVENLADRIIIALDSSSNDGTRDILKKFNCEVYETEFEDFSQIRNVTRDHAKGDWFFWFDADERLVRPELVRQFTNTNIYEGAAIPQRHLMLDIQGTHDLPVRLLKNRPHYRFTGAIHEHCEDTSKGLFDNPIFPTLELECDIAHYGYLNESARRKKCSYRNMSLLRKDIMENASRGRMLTWVLVMRDYINICKWEYWKERKLIQKDSIMHTLINAVISTYLVKFADKVSRYTVLADGLYQEALMILGRSGLCYEGYPHPPFEVDLGLAGSVGGIDPKADITPKRRWFLDSAEFMAFLQEKGIELATGLKLCNEDECPKVSIPTFKVTPELPDAARLLRLGVAYK